MRRTMLAAGAAALSAALLLTLATPASADPSHHRTESAADSQLALARAASARYHDVGAAIADGYIPTDDCTELPGVGGMGYHYINPARLVDGEFDLTRPDILLYAPSQDGPRLAGIEFFKPDNDQNLSTDDDRPSLLGQAFDGPMPGHEPGMPIHYDLHVWLWKSNPNGLFAPWNPRVRCPSPTLM
jgi:hypothetical protein